MALRLTSAPVFGFAGLAAAIAAAGLTWSELAGRAGMPEAVVTIARARDPLVGLVPSPDLPIERIAIEAGILSTEPTTFAGLYSGSLSAFALRPALTEQDTTSRFEATIPAAIATDPAAASPIVGTETAPVAALPPPRPTLDSPAMSADTTLAILNVRPPVRPRLPGGVKLASLDPNAPIGEIPETPAESTPRTQGFGGVFGSWARQDLQVTPTAPAIVATPSFKDDGRGQRGAASWYGPGFHGRKTASGERFDQMAMTAAHRTLPFGTLVRVVDDQTGSSVVVRINDRGPYAHGRIIDLSKGAAQALGIGGRGVMRVRVVSAE